MEYCSNGSLFEQILNKQYEKKSFSEEEIINMILHISKAIRIIHIKGFSYRDLKIENLLYFSDEKIKLCDFGSINNKSISLNNLN